MSSEHEGDGYLVSVVEVSDAGPLVLVSRSVTPPQSPSPGVQDKSSVFLLNLDLRDT